jgi:hypothetical protein
VNGAIGQEKSAMHKKQLSLENPTPSKISEKMLDRVKANASHTRVSTGVS